jgi:hypothetical protein
MPITTTSNQLVMDPQTGKLSIAAVTRPRGLVVTKQLYHFQCHVTRPQQCEIIDLSLSPVADSAAAPALLESLPLAPLSSSGAGAVDVPLPRMKLPLVSRVVAASSPDGPFIDECKELRAAKRTAHERAIRLPIPQPLRASPSPPKYTAEEMGNYVYDPDLLGFGPYPFVPPAFNEKAHALLSPVLQRDMPWLSRSRAIRKFGLNRDVIVSASLSGGDLMSRRELRGGMGYTRNIWVYQPAGLIRLAMAKWKSHFALAHRNYNNDKNRESNRIPRLKKLSGSKYRKAELRLHLDGIL